MALVMSYLDWGGSSAKPQIAIVDWDDVPTVNEFEILQERFERMGIPNGSSPIRANWSGTANRWPRGTSRSIWSNRRVLINDIVAKPRGVPRWSKRIRRTPCAWRITSAARFHM